MSTKKTKQEISTDVKTLFKDMFETKTIKTSSLKKLMPLKELYVSENAQGTFIWSSNDLEMPICKMTYNFNDARIAGSEYLHAKLIIKSVNMHDELIYLLNTIRQKIGITNVLSKNELDNINCLLKQEVQIK